MTADRQLGRAPSFILAGAMVVLFIVVGLASMTMHDATGLSEPSLRARTSPPSGMPSPTEDPTQNSTADAGSMSEAALNARPGQGPIPAATAVDCPGPTVQVRNKEELNTALGRANPGDVISLSDGVYSGNFTADRAATPERRIYLCGGPGAVLDGGGTDTGYVLHLDHADYWVVSGLTVRNGQKGIVADTVKGAIFQKVTVTGLGQEGIHLRRNSTANLVVESTVRDTGKVTPEYGEGIYVGTAVSNWCSLTACRPDESNFNLLARNTISNTTAENIDIKEGTIQGVISGNSLSGNGMTSSDAWVNVKGNAWTIENNTGTDSPRDGFQTHNILLGWGDHNLFRSNIATIGGRGTAVASTPPMNNTVACSNQVIGSGRLSNIKCSHL